MRMRLKHTRRPDERGNTLIEFAVVLPAFFGILFGIIDAAYVLRQQIGASHSVRETARAISTLRRDQIDCDPTAFETEISALLAVFMQGNAVYNPTDASAIEVDLLGIEDLDSDIEEDVRYDMHFVRLAVQKQVPCVWCEFFGGQGVSVHATSTVRLEDAWLCNSNPFNFYGFAS